MLNRRNLLKAALSLPYLPALESAAPAAYAMAWPKEAGPLIVCGKKLAPGWFQIRLHGETHQEPFIELPDGRLRACVPLEKGEILVYWGYDYPRDRCDIVFNPSEGVRDATLAIEWYRVRMGRKRGELLGPFQESNLGMMRN